MPLNFNQKGSYVPPEPTMINVPCDIIITKQIIVKEVGVGVTQTYTRTDTWDGDVYKKMPDIVIVDSLTPPDADLTYVDGADTAIVTKEGQCTVTAGVALLGSFQRVDKFQHEDISSLRSITIKQALPIQEFLLGNVEVNWEIFTAGAVSVGKGVCLPNVPTTIDRGLIVLSGNLGYVIVSSEYRPVTGAATVVNFVPGVISVAYDFKNSYENILANISIVGGSTVIGKLIFDFVLDFLQRQFQDADTAWGKLLNIVARTLDTPIGDFITSVASAVAGGLALRSDNDPHFDWQDFITGSDSYATTLIGLIGAVGLELAATAFLNLAGAKFIPDSLLTKSADAGVRIALGLKALAYLSTVGVRVD